MNAAGKNSEESMDEKRLTVCLVFVSGVGYDFDPESPLYPARESSPLCSRLTDWNEKKFTRYTIFFAYPGANLCSSCE